MLNHRHDRFTFQIYFLILVFVLSSASVSGVRNAVRPRIGVVLSGGGAKGFAHIGTLKMLDSLQIPVDYITGTSMGGIIGALYSVGYSGRQLEDLVIRTDWKEIFTDEPQRSLLPYFNKKERNKYLLDFGIEGLKLTAPSGLIFGEKISLLFSSLTFEYENIADFDKLPISFRCISVDLVTGNEVILGMGSLATAMRSTMSIPTVFSPVEWGDSLLIDGGIYNNLPVDVVKNMGADIVIAVDVGRSSVERKQLNSALAVLEQSMAILGHHKWKENISQTDILIRPELSEFKLMDFENDKIFDIIEKGNLAAEQNRAAFAALKESIQGIILEEFTEPKDDMRRILEFQIPKDSQVSFQMICSRLDMRPGDLVNHHLLQSRLDTMRASEDLNQFQCEIVDQPDNQVSLVVRIDEKPVPKIYRIEITGHETLPFGFIYNLLGLKPGDGLNTEDLNRRIMSLYALGYFESIKYEIESHGDIEVILKLIVKESPQRKLSLGIRYDDMHNLVVALAVQANNFLLPGLRAEHELQFAGLTKFSSRLYYPSRTLNLPIYPYVRFRYKDIPTNIFESDGSQIASYKDRSISFAGGIGLLLSKSFHAEIDYRHEYMKIQPKIAFSDPSMFPEWKDKLRLVCAAIELDLLDDVILPKQGVLLKGVYEGSFKKLNSDIYYEKVNASADLYYTLHENHTLRIYGFWGDSRSLPIYKFLNQGRPHTFVGVEYDQIYGSRMTMLRTDYRLQLRRNIYLKLIANVAFNLKYETPLMSPQINNFWGYGIGIKMVSPVGPIEFILSWGDKRFLGPREMQSEKYYLFGFNF